MEKQEDCGGILLTLILKCASAAFKGVTLIGRTLPLIVSDRAAVAAAAVAADGLCGAVAVLGGVLVATLLDAVAVNDADRFALGRCLTT